MCVGIQLISSQMSMNYDIRSVNYTCCTATVAMSPLGCCAGFYGKREACKSTGTLRAGKDHAGKGKDVACTLLVY